MKIGLSRFIYYTEQVNELLINARKQENPALWLFNNNARTPFFMLEALSRFYAEMHNPKRFDKLNEHFKLIEDGLGKIDYYQSLNNTFAAKRRIPAVSRHYIKNQLDISVEQLNETLLKKDWLSPDNRRILKINKKLEGAEWLKPAEELKEISKIYKSSIHSITQFATESKFHFDNVEDDVHELRRKLRWLSIYPQAFQGAIQYSEYSKKSPHLKKYMTKEIVSSPFNQFPPAGNNSSIFFLQKSYFLALSWIIAQLGKLKDEGLLLTGLCEALQQTSHRCKEENLEVAKTLLGRKQRSMQEILDEAETITKAFFTEGNLQQLIS